MEDTRKQIIELIEPYMNKTLSEGCLIDLHGTIYTAITKIHHGKIGVLTQTDYGKRFDKVICFKTIGHYDITAVLKYFEDKIYKIKLCEGYLSIEYPDKRGLSGLFNLYTKPLHLYTEKQEKDLLELLKKLG